MNVLGPVGLVFRAELRRRWRSWLALAGLIALVGGLVLGATAAGRRTATAFPRFVASHGYDYGVVNTQPMPRLAKLPEVASVTLARVPGTGQPICACTHKITTDDFTIFPLSSPVLSKLVKLSAGRMPDQSKPDEVLASFTLVRDFGIHVGSVIKVPFYVRAQEAEALNGVGTPKGPTIDLHVVGIAVDELAFVAQNGGEGPFYDVYGTQALARAELPACPGLRVVLRAAAARSWGCPALRRRCRPAEPRLHHSPGRHGHLGGDIDPPPGGGVVGPGRAGRLGRTRGRRPGIGAPKRDRERGLPDPGDPGPSPRASWPASPWPAP